MSICEGRASSFNLKYKIQRQHISRLKYDIEPDPLRLYEAIKGTSEGFLLESADRCGEMGRFSLIGIHPLLKLVATGQNIEVTGPDGPVAITGNPFDLIKHLLHASQVFVEPQEYEVPLAQGGLAGWIGYDAVRHIEVISDTVEEPAHVEDIHMVQPEHLVVIDRDMKMVHCMSFQILDSDAKPIRAGHGKGHGSMIQTLETLLDLPQIQKTEQTVQALRNDEENAIDAAKNLATKWTSITDQSAFENSVLKAKQYIRMGDAFQLVFSRRLVKQTKVDALKLYEQLRGLNPSPYMFIVSTKDVQVVGASPETMVRMQKGQAVIHPIAGTRPRGRTEEEDCTYESELMNDVKENAEHLMLVDLARNDLGRISEFGSVQVPQFRTVERFSHVMHLVSEVTGQVDEHMDSVDVFKACFPAGTVSGAPKIRAMSIIDEVEPVRRGVYAGAVGWFGVNGDMDTCIAIRTAVLKDGKVHVQAGGGLVQDSDPTAEYMETLHKASSIMKAVKMAEDKEDTHDSRYR